MEPQLVQALQRAMCKGVTAQVAQAYGDADDDDDDHHHHDDSEL